jgi:hypothetical protein
MIRNFNSSISKLHIWRCEATGDFFAQCVPCLLAREELLRIEHNQTTAAPLSLFGCSKPGHSGNSRHVRAGNPTNDNEYVIFFERIKENSTWLSRGRQPLTVQELKGLVLTQLSKNDEFEVMIAVMCMFAANGFMREDEFGSVSAGQILWEYSNLNASPRISLPLTFSVSYHQDQRKEGSRLEVPSDIP